ncbi:MAG: substrate-binding domain-containing protein [Alphaproteobacteria bacterium]|nr:substrate-binding domain-containing protein [Alphaproteobacteria bacterium]MBU1812387.1 substrate-binding domain-containing protein [Alphaproteobacteria bacterium]
MISLCTGMLQTPPAQASDGLFRAPISIALSSDIRPFADRIIDYYDDRNPRTGFSVQETSAPQAMRRFCAGQASEAVQVAALPRRMWRSEARRCDSNNVAFVEHVMGAQAMVILASKETPAFNLDLGTLYRAISGSIVVTGEPATRWRQLDSRLPDAPIRILLPARSGGLRNLLDEAGLQVGCQRVSAVRAIADTTARVAACIRLRGDGLVVESADAAGMIADLASAAPGTIALLPRDAMESAAGPYSVISIDGVQPTLRAIWDGSYPLARHFHIYARQGASVSPDLYGFVLTASSRSFTQPGGTFDGMGLILPLAGDSAPVPARPQNGALGRVENMAGEAAAKAQAAAQSAWSGVLTLAGSVAGLFRSDSLGDMTQSALQENKDLTRLLELAGFDLIRIEREGRFLPALTAIFERRRELSDVERGLLESESARIAQSAGDSASHLKLAVIDDLLDVAQEGRFQVDEIAVDFTLLPGLRYTLVPVAVQR